MSPKNTIPEILQELHVQSADDVTVRTFRNVRASSVQEMTEMAGKRAEAITRGECVARAPDSPNGRSTTITAAAAAALIAAGATDKRDEAPGAP